MPIGLEIRHSRWGNDLPFPGKYGHREMSHSASRCLPLQTKIAASQNPSTTQLHVGSVAQLYEGRTSNRQIDRRTIICGHGRCRWSERLGTTTRRLRRLEEEWTAVNASAFLADNSLLVPFSRSVTVNRHVKQSTDFLQANPTFHYLKTQHSRHTLQDLLKVSICPSNALPLCLNTLSSYQRAACSTFQTQSGLMPMHSSSGAWSNDLDFASHRL